MKNWLRYGPSLTDLRIEEKDERKGKKQIAIVMPIADTGLLKKHLAKLEKQNLQNFDLILVYAKDSRYIEKPKWASILNIREQEKTGIAGAYYLGEKKALEEGYKIIILADADCFPMEDDLLEKLVSALENGMDVVMPRLIYGTRAFPGHNIHHYGCIKREVLEKAGLTYLPFCIGGEDTELLERIIRMGFKTGNINCKAFHPIPIPIYLTDEKRVHYYAKGNIRLHLVRGRYLRALISIVRFSFEALALIVIGKMTRAMQVFYSLWSVSGLRLFMENKKLKKLPLPLEISSSKEDYDIVVEGEPESRKTGSKTMIGQVFAHLKDLPRYFGKKVLIEADVVGNRLRDPSIMLMARRSDVLFRGRTFRVCEERSISSIVLGILIALLVAPLALTYAIVVWLKGSITSILLGIRTERYGLDTRSDL